MLKNLMITILSLLPFFVSAQRFIESSAIKTFQADEFHGDTNYVTVYGVLDLIESDSAKKVPMYRFNNSGNSDGICWVNITHTHRPISFMIEDAPGWTDTYQDTFSLKELYSFLYNKTKEFKRTSFKDGASKMVLMDIEQYISAQKVSQGILLKWWTTNSLLQVVLTPNGTLIDPVLKNIPKGFNANCLAWIVANSTFGIW